MLPILEGLVTTTDADGSMHFAPMGPRVDRDWRTLLLRPFPTSRTFRNLKAHGEGVLHVTDDVLVLARAAVGAVERMDFRCAESINGYVLLDACRYYEFRVRALDETGDRVRIEADIVRSVTLRDFWGFNRAKHAVLEAAILATRLHLLPTSEVSEEYRKLKIIVEKTGGEQEREAFDFLEGFLLRFGQMKESG